MLQRTIDCTAPLLSQRHAAVNGPLSMVLGVMSANSALLYRQLVDGLRLVASPYETQVAVLPDFVNVPDEVLNAVDSAYFRQLREDGTLSQVGFEALRDFDEFADTWPECDDYDTALRALREGSWFQEFRIRAHTVLDVLGELYSKPMMHGVTYVQGA